MLYLNVDTFDEAGKQLAQKLREARSANMPVVMAHENDAARGGCEFSKCCRTTPEDLINNGLYKALAIPLYPGEDHRMVGKALIAKALGAVPCRSKLAEGVARLSHSRISMRKRVGRESHMEVWKCELS